MKSDFRLLKLKALNDISAPISTPTVLDFGWFASHL